MNENIKVNDGKGLYDNEGLCDSLKQDLNNMIKLAMSVQFVAACGLITGMSVKLTNLKQGIKNDSDSKKEQIEELKRINDELMKQSNEKDGAEHGND